jgi:hypothetical protein
VEPEVFAVFEESVYLLQELLMWVVYESRGGCGEVSYSVDAYRTVGEDFEVWFIKVIFDGYVYGC